jgi:hypothetical protein
VKIGRYTSSRSCTCCRWATGSQDGSQFDRYCDGTRRSMAFRSVVSVLVKFVVRRFSNELKTTLD